MNETNPDSSNFSHIMSDDYKEAFKKIEIIKMLPNETSDQIWAKGETISLKVGEVLFEEGSYNQKMYVILSGRIEVFKKDKTIAFRGPMEFLGEISLVEPRPRSAGVRAITETVLFEISKDIFDLYFAPCPEILMEFLKILSDRARSDLETLNWGYKELKKSERLYRTIVETISEIVFILNEERHIVFANSAFKYLGYEPEEVIGKPIVELINTEDSEFDLEELATKGVGPFASLGLNVILKTNPNSVLWEEFQTTKLVFDSFGMWDVPDEFVYQDEIEKNFLGTICVGHRTS
jgi:CRP-like cAMP-binding protein